MARIKSDLSEDELPVICSEREREPTVTDVDENVTQPTNRFTASVSYPSIEGTNLSASCTQMASPLFLVYQSLRLLTKPNNYAN